MKYIFEFFEMLMDINYSFRYFMYFYHDLSIHFYWLDRFSSFFRYYFRNRVRKRRQFY